MTTEEAANLPTIEEWEGFILGLLDHLQGRISPEAICFAWLDLKCEGDWDWVLDCLLQDSLVEGVELPDTVLDEAEQMLPLVVGDSYDRCRNWIDGHRRMKRTTA